MKTDKYVTRSLIAATIIAFIFIILTSYFAHSGFQYRKDITTIQNELALTKNDLSSMQKKYHSEIEKSIKLSEELENANATIANLKSNEYELIYIGDYKLTHYCTEKRKHICGMGAGITATGTQVTAGRTVAVDPRVIPYGTEIYIEGYGWRVAEDCGGAVSGNHIDVAVETHSKALSMGTKIGGVWILVRQNY